MLYTSTQFLLFWCQHIKFFSVFTTINIIIILDYKQLMPNYWEKNAIELFLQRKKYFFNRFAHWEYNPDNGRFGIQEAANIFLINEVFLQNKLEKKPIFKKEFLNLLPFLIDPTYYFWYSQWFFEDHQKTISSLLFTKNIFRNIFIFSWYGSHRAHHFIKKFIGKHYFNFTKSLKFKGASFFKKKQFYLFHNAKMRMLLILKYREEHLEGVFKEFLLLQHQMYWLTCRYRRKMKIFFFLYKNLFSFLVKYKLYLTQKLQIVSNLKSINSDVLSYFTNYLYSKVIFFLQKSVSQKVLWLACNFFEVLNWSSYNIWWLSTKYLKNTPLFLGPLFFKKSLKFSPWRFYFNNTMKKFFLKITISRNTLSNKRFVLSKVRKMCVFAKPFSKNKRLLFLSNQTGAFILSSSDLL